MSLQTEKLNTQLTVSFFPKPGKWWWLSKSRISLLTILFKTVTFCSKLTIWSYLFWPVLVSLLLLIYFTRKNSFRKVFRCSRPILVFNESLKTRMFVVDPSLCIFLLAVDKCNFLCIKYSPNDPWKAEPKWLPSAETCQRPNALWGPCGPSPAPLNELAWGVAKVEGCFRSIKVNSRRPIKEAVAGARVWSTKDAARLR